MRFAVRYDKKHNSLEDIGARIGAWASGEPDELLDEWYDKYGSRNPNGDAREIILRDGLKYQGNGGIIKTEGMYRTTDDPLREVMGSASQNNYKELTRILEDLRNSGIEVEISSTSSSMGYQPYPSRSERKPGRVKMSDEASLAAWLHEQQHSIDDEKSGWNGLHILYFDPDERYQWEVRAYQIEIDLARSFEREDIVKELCKI